MFFASSSLRRLRARIDTRAPSEAAWMARARPMPLDPPVMNTCRFLIGIVVRWGRTMKKRKRRRRDRGRKRRERRSRGKFVIFSKKSRSCSTDCKKVCKHVVCQSYLREEHDTVLVLVLGQQCYGLCLSIVYSV